MSEEQKTIELAACPFCGGVPFSPVYVKDGAEISCSNCGASIIRYAPDSIKKAIKAWNARIQGDEK